jgi:hypothetical protein
MSHHTSNGDNTWICRPRRIFGLLKLLEYETLHIKESLRTLHIFETNIADFIKDKFYI